MPETPSATSATMFSIPQLPTNLEPKVAESLDRGVSTQNLEQVEQMLDETEMAVAVATRQDDERATTPAVQLSVIVPVYNEAATIGQIVSRIQAQPLVDEIILVDDGSTDGTRQLLHQLEGAPGIGIVYHRRNRGKGAAVRTGLMQARGELVAVQDADLEYDPAEYARLVEPILAGEADVVYGSRYLAGRPTGQRISHRLANRALTFLSNVTTRRGLTDMETGAKLFRRSFLSKITLAEDGFGFEPEITAKLARRGARFAEVPVGYKPRGRSEGKKIGLRDGLRAVWCVLRYGLAD